MASLIFIRHGQSTYNLENRFTGNVDVHLSPLGIEEAHTAGKKIKAFHFDAAYTSSLIRAHETLAIILDEIEEKNITVIKNTALDERRYGSLQGLNKDETIQKYGAHQVELWRRSYTVQPPDGESLEDTYNRTVPYYKSEIVPQLKLGKNILIVAHGNSLHALMMYLEELTPEEIQEINIATGLPRMYSFDQNLKILDIRDI